MLETLLQDYAGTLFLVSHDRRFLDNVVTQCIVAEGDGLWREYAGGYEDWLAARARAPRTVPAATEKIAVALPAAETRREQRTKISYRETQELIQLPDRIATLEKEQAAIIESLADAKLYRDAPMEAKRLQERAGAIDVELELLLQRWEELEQRST